MSVTFVMYSPLVDRLVYGYGAHSLLNSYVMKKKKTPSTPPEAGNFQHEVFCAQCRKRIRVKQQKHTITTKIVGKNHKDVATVILEASDVLRITVDKHNCVFHMLVDKAGSRTKESPIRSALNDWNYLTPYGLVQVSRNTIVNIAHVREVTKDRIYLKHLDVGISVTNTYVDTVSEALEFWFDIDHRFSC